jgi:hypothetical protein
MKIWKIEHTNKSAEGAKIAISLSSNESRGIILKPGEFVLAQEQPTASLDSQTRRGYVKVEPFDNSSLNLKMGEAYSISLLSTKTTEPVVETIVETEAVSLDDELPMTETEKKEHLSKLEEAEKDASDYINNDKENK